MDYSTHKRNQNDRNDRTAAGIVWLCAFALLAFIWMAQGCVTNSDGTRSPDWPKVEVAAEEIVATLDAQSLAWAHRPGVVQDLQRLKAAVQLVDDAVERIRAGETGVGFNAYLDAAVAIVDELLTQSDDEDVLALLSGIRASLGLARVLAA